MIKLIDLIRKSYAEQDYSGAMGAGSIGLQKRQRAAESLPVEEKEEFLKNSNKYIFTGGVAIPAAIGAHAYAFGPMYNAATTASAQASQGGAAGTLIIGDVVGTTAGLSGTPYLLEKWKQEAAKRTQQKKRFGGQLNYLSLFN